MPLRESLLEELSSHEGRHALAIVRVCVSINAKILAIDQPHLHTSHAHPLLNFFASKGGTADVTIQLRSYEGVGTGAR